ncbi:hypothetical protein ORV05_02635 [Amycolatopsis cynarae]|uniref:Secreted protein n=1 Tax=Amycolatopsis cynarae TaxID=2995223 RepID=A0ABY7B343_9PSEU|nr:hypothetical protein [Amycolatopsis sp. HUAS 11-8]WAL66731.1 hypothetical protein ORV05_02635 [Amycolatopsis sp. HUAS 11-8]
MLDATAGAVVDAVLDAVAEAGGVLVVVLLVMVVVDDDEAGVLVAALEEVPSVVGVPEAASRVLAAVGRLACMARVGVWDCQGPPVTQTVKPRRNAAVTAASTGNFLFFFALWRPAISVPFSYCG